MSDEARRTFNERYENNFLQKLRTLPESIFRQCVFRLQQGETAISVARWLLSVPNRGGMQGVDKLHTMRRYLEILGRQVLRLMENIPPPAVTPTELQQIVQQERRRVDNEIAIAGGPMGSDSNSALDSMLRNHAQTLDRRMIYKAVVAANCHRMRLAHCVEEKMKMPLADGTKISQLIVQTLEADLRAELADLQIAKEKRADAAKSFGAITLDDLAQRQAAAPMRSAPSPDRHDAAGEIMFLASPEVSEFIGVHINFSRRGRQHSATVIEKALRIVYAADLWREFGEDEEHVVSTTAAGKDFNNGHTRESGKAAAEAINPSNSPEKALNFNPVASGLVEPGLAMEKFDALREALPMVSAADRLAVCNQLEALLMITESENVFRKQLPTEEAKPGDAQPNQGAHYCTSPENLELLREIVAGADSLSTVAKMLFDEVIEVALLSQVPARA